MKLSRFRLILFFLFLGITAAIFVSLEYFGEGSDSIQRTFFRLTAAPEKQSASERHSGEKAVRIPRTFYYQTPPPKELKAMKRAIKKSVRNKEKIHPLFGLLPYPKDYLKFIPIKPTDVIADIGSGTGVFEILLLENNIQFKRIYAVDINKPSLDFLRYVLDASDYDGAKKVHLVQSEDDDIRLPAESTDIAIIINTSVFDARVDSEGRLTIDEREQQCLETIKKALKPEGKVYFFHGFARLNQVGKEDRLRKDLGFDQFSYSFGVSGFRVLKKEIIKINGADNYHLIFEKAD